VVAHRAAAVDVHPERAQTARVDPECGDEDADARREFVRVLGSEARGERRRERDRRGVRSGLRGVRGVEVGVRAREE